MNLNNVIKNFLQDNIEEEKSSTFKCPECGSKVLKKTGYCVKCKKKVGKTESESEGNGDE